MAQITTETNWVRVDTALIQKGTRDVIQTGTGVRLQSVGTGAVMDIPVAGSTIDGSPVTDAQELFAFFQAQGFKNGGGAPVEGVQSVTGDAVDNTDPMNPVIGNTAWDDIDGKPAVIAEGATAAAARTAIGLGTASTQASTAFATAAQGTLAASAVQRVGDTMNGGLGFGSATVASAQDLSRHIALYGAASGITITSGAMNFVMGSNPPTNHFEFYLTTNLVGIINLTIDNPKSLITKEYFDANIPAGGNIGAPETHTATTVSPSATDVQVHLVDCTAGNVMFNLPDATDGTVAGKVFTIKKIDSSVNGVDIDAGEANIDGQASQGIADQYAFITVVFDGTNYQIIG